MSGLRLQKWLSQMGVASRREAERWIKEGRVTVNGKTHLPMGRLVDPKVDQILVNGESIARKRPKLSYWMLNKPDFTLTTRSDPRGRPTIYEIPRVKRISQRLSPVGRLDFRTEGMLLLSNDGDFVQRLSHPKYKVPRIYSVLLPGPLSEDKIERITKRLYLPDGPVRGVKLRKGKRQSLGSSRGQWYLMTVHEGRNRIVRRIFEAVGMRVIRLIRVGMGNLYLPSDLKPGQVRALSDLDLLSKLKSPSPSQLSSRRVT